MAILFKKTQQNPSQYTIENVAVSYKKYSWNYFSYNMNTNDHDFTFIAKKKKNAALKIKHVLKTCCLKKSIFISW